MEIHKFISIDKDAENNSFLIDSNRHSNSNSNKDVAAVGSTY